MKIPDKIQIAGRIFDIVYNNELNNEYGSSAEINPDKCKIIIQGNCKGNERNQQSIYISFLHEIIHAISKISGNRKLYEDEQFTEQFTELLYQVIKQIT
ncbi:MAG: hypothetical protein GWP19_11750 [Planctomycetia bacterium]|nr:hypothetical protein [Planctomycetia bacterium]